MIKISPCLSVSCCKELKQSYFCSTLGTVHFYWEEGGGAGGIPWVVPVVYDYPPLHKKFWGCPALSHYCFISTKYNL